MDSQISVNQYARAKELFSAALELDSSEHTDFLLENCGEDIELLNYVKKLLVVGYDAQEFFESANLETIFPGKNLINKNIGGYRLIRELGEGGMGIVWLAEKHETEFSRKVALKLIKSNFYSKSLIRRFNLERKILNSLEHPNIARMLDSGASNEGIPYFVMEYVEGVPLLEYTKENEPSLAERLEIFRQVCSAVSFAHKNAVIHRDLKPSNIFVTSDGTVKLLDFGIAKLLASDTQPQIKTATTFPAMTPEYASPEQVKGESITTASDVYSLGVVLFEFLTGISPYKTDSGNLNEIIQAVCEAEPDLPSIVLGNKKSNKESDSVQKATNPVILGVGSTLLKGDLDTIILKALQKNPERRYQSVESFSEDLQRHLDGLPVLARPDTFTYRTGKFVRRNLAAVIFASLGILALILGMGATIWQSYRVEQQRVRAELRFNDVRTLVNSFMFELNDEILKGQTQSRELVVKRALEYLDRLSAESNDDPSLLRESAIGYLKLGDIQGKPYSPNLGDTHGAIESYQKAQRILEVLNQKDPTNRDVKRDLSLAYASLGSIQRLRLVNKSLALENLQKALNICEELLKEDSTNPQYRQIQGDIYKSLGDSLNEHDERLVMQRKALAIHKELLANDPSNAQEQVAVASIYQRIGTLLTGKYKKSLDLGKYQEILLNFNKALEIYQSLAESEPTNSIYQQNVANLLSARVPIQIGLGDIKEANDGYQRSLKVFEKLVLTDPKNIETQLYLAYTHQFMCKSLVNLNDSIKALKSCQQGLKVGEALLLIDPKNEEARSYIYESYSLIAQLLEKKGDKDGAIKNYEQLLLVMQQWVNLDPENVFPNLYVVFIKTEIGKLHKSLAMNEKSSDKNRREKLMTACNWFNQSLDGWRDLQQKKLARDRDINLISEMEQEVSHCK